MCRTVKQKISEYSNSIPQKLSTAGSGIFLFPFQCLEAAISRHRPLVQLDRTLSVSHFQQFSVGYGILGTAHLQFPSAPVLVKRTFGSAKSVAPREVLLSSRRGVDTLGVREKAPNQHLAQWSATSPLPKAGQLKICLVEKASFLPHCSAQWQWNAGAEVLAALSSGSRRDGIVPHAL